MRKIKLLGISLVVTVTMLGVMAGSAGAVSRNTYEWCYANRTCFGIVTLNKSGKTWVYRIGGNEEIAGSFTKKGKSWHFEYENAASEACEVRMTKERRNFGGAIVCDGNEVEAAEWRRL